ncbi:histidine kinase [Massilia sp. PAMC28688]|uniref:sensor histidine kinase n=1 Tax=Massilia sp. PAMC28688 TaxID=2861283 RepID=UPI001C624A03|nr:ATP-binding protein [Massilia sp. PAMC28688]QYF93420.1 histidine kinase [Massilia sp. PAMC28688]
MSTPAPEQFDAEIERRVAERTADLSELLGHMVTCWDDERRQLARKLHDSLGSSMTALTMHLSLLTQQMPQEKVLQNRTAQMKTLLMNIINTNRDMQLAIWNDKLEFLGVKAALTELVSEFGAEHNIVARVSLPEEDAGYPREHGVALLRTVEEGLRNVLAHAQASEVDVVLDDNDEEIMLTVRDNGVGPGNYDRKARDCHGLRLLRERAQYLGGSLSVSPLPGRGTALAIILPREQQEAPADTPG